MLATLIQASPQLAEPLQGAPRAARSGAPILVVGEPGTGRTTLARALHAASGRDPLVEVDTAVIPASLFEGELFGYRAGAFTGAETSADGRLARAAGGSLLLEHVEELPREAQAKLLRLVAEQRYTPLGGHERQADVRFLATASDDVEERMRRGVFRDDLYYRLAVLTYRLPPLRDRADDIVPIVHHLLDDLALRFGRSKPALSARARDWMQTYPWPGNLRQLRNVLERSFVLTEGDTLDPEPLAAAAERPRSLAEVEREHIRRALVYTRGNQTEAAELLGVSRKSLWEKRKRYGLP